MKSFFPYKIQQQAMGIQEKQNKESAAAANTVTNSPSSSSASSIIGSNGGNMITIDGIPKCLTIKTSKTTSRSSSNTTATTTTTTTTTEPNYNRYSSPSPLISPPSSAFASALQSPYISPRTPPLVSPPLPHPPPCSNSHSDAAVHSSNSSTSCTPPPDDNRSEFSDACASSDHDNNHHHHHHYLHLNNKPPFHSNPATTEPPPPPHAAPRLSFTFPVIPRVSFARGGGGGGGSTSISSSTVPTLFNNNNTRLRSCDVFIGYHSSPSTHHHHYPTDTTSSDLHRFSKWLKSELEMQGIACFLADRGRYADSQSHEIADRVICSVSYGIVLVSTAALFSNRFCVEELRFFSQKKNLIPILFDSGLEDLIRDGGVGGDVFDDDDVERREAIDGLVRAHEWCKLEVGSGGDWRNCVVKAAGLLTSKLGRKSMLADDGGRRRLSCRIETSEQVDDYEELPFVRNKRFVGRHKEISEIELSFFGGGRRYSSGSHNQRSRNHRSGVGIRASSGSAKSSSASERVTEDDEEDEINLATHHHHHHRQERQQQQQRYINLEIAAGKRCSSSSESGGNARSYSFKQQQRLPPSSKYKKSRMENSQLVCITGPPGIGKTELALEFAYRHRHKYKQVLWIGGESRYMRQNILNIAHERLNLDVSADPEKDRGRIRSFEEQENEVFKRVRREIFKEMPFLVVIDNLESEEEWWEGKDLQQELIPRNMGGSHVIITTRLEKVKMNGCLMMQLERMTVPEMMMVMGLTSQGEKEEVEEGEVEYVKKFNERLLGRSVFGLTVVGCLMSELRISPDALYEAVEHYREEEGGGDGLVPAVEDDDGTVMSPFLRKLLGFCFSVLEKENKRSSSSGNCLIASRMLLVGSCLAPAPVSASILAAAAKNMSSSGCSSSSSRRVLKWKSSCFNQATFCCSAAGGCGGGFTHQTQVNSSAMMLVKLGLARRTTRRRGGLFWIQFHPIVTQFFGWMRKRVGPMVVQAAAVTALRKIGDPVANSDHLWASAFLMFGFGSDTPLVPRVKAIETVTFIKKTALPLAVWAYTTFSRCKSALELLQVCTGALEEVEKSFVARVEEWPPGQWGWGGWGWKKRSSSSNSGNRMMMMKSSSASGGNNKEKVDEYVWQEVTLLKATLLETRAKLLVRGGCFDSAEELCRTCISIRTVMLGHTHVHTLAAQQTLAKLVRLRTKI